MISKITLIKGSVGTTFGELQIGEHFKYGDYLFIKIDYAGSPSNALRLDQGKTFQPKQEFANATPIERVKVEITATTV